MVLCDGASRSSSKVLSVSFKRVTLKPSPFRDVMNEPASTRFGLRLCFSLSWVTTSCVIPPISSGDTPPRLFISRTVSSLLEMFKNARSSSD